MYGFVVPALAGKPTNFPAKAGTTNPYTQLKTDLNRFGGDLTAGAPLLGELAGTLYDRQGHNYNFTESVARQQFCMSLSDAFARTAVLFSDLLPAGQRGWLKLWTVEERALLDAAFTRQQVSLTSVFRQGHNLHKLALTTTTTLTLSVLPPFI